MSHFKVFLLEIDLTWKKSQMKKERHVEKKKLTQKNKWLLFSFSIYSLSSVLKNSKYTHTRPTNSTSPTDRKSVGTGNSVGIGGDVEIFATDTEGDER